MRASTRLGLYGALLVIVFGAAFATAGAVVPREFVESWAQETEDHEGGHDMNGDGHSDAGQGHESSAYGLTLESENYRIADLSAPAKLGEEGELTLSITGPDGRTMTDFELSHEKELHLIVVRSDGAQFRHVHPERDTEGQWSIPWTWDKGGSYRVFTEFVPTEAEETITLSSTVQIAGDIDPQTVDAEVTTAKTDDFEVDVDGELTAGEASMLTVTVSRDGEPVTTLQPYLGAYGHLVALREGDLAYLHVHPHGEEPSPGETSGPEVAFEVTAPTAGRYLLYLDFQVDGKVHTAELVLDAKGSGAGASDPSEDDAGHEEGESHDHD